MAYLVAVDSCCLYRVTYQHPIPDWWSACKILRASKGKLGRLETIGLRNCDREPDDVQSKVENNDGSRNSEDPFVSLGVEVIHANGEAKDGFRNDPLYSAKFNIGNIGDEGGDAKDREL